MRNTQLVLKHHVTILIANNIIVFQIGSTTNLHFYLKYYDIIDCEYSYVVLQNHPNISRKNITGLSLYRPTLIAINLFQLLGTMYKAMDIAGKPKLARAIGSFIDQVSCCEWSIFISKSFSHMHFILSSYICTSLHHFC